MNIDDAIHPYQNRIEDLKQQLVDLRNCLDDARDQTSESHQLLSACISLLKRDALRYRYLRGADPDSGPYIGSEEQTDWGNWTTRVLLSKIADDTIDEAIKRHV